VQVHRFGIAGGHDEGRASLQHRAALEDFTDPSFVAALDQSGYIDGLYRKSATAN
jgi:hypothetical protein